MENYEVILSINKDPSFTEVWYEGCIEHDGEEYKFWLIDPQGKDPNGHTYEVDVRWFFKQVPREIRRLVPQIIEQFKKAHHYDRREN